MLSKREKIKKGHQLSGFTLIEFIIYSVIIALLMGALIFSGANILSTRLRIIAMEEMNKNVNNSLEKIAFLIRNSEGVNSAGSGSLSLQMPSPNNPTVISLDNNAIIITEGGVSKQLTTTPVSVTSLIFDEFSEDAVRINTIFEVESSSPREEFTIIREFSLTENVRNK